MSAQSEIIHHRIYLTKLNGGPVPTPEQAIHALAEMEGTIDRLIAERDRARADLDDVRGMLRRARRELQAANQALAASAQRAASRPLLQSEASQ